MNIPCAIIRDLIPLCKDGVASEESCDMVSEHIKCCVDCNKEYEDTISSTEIKPAMPDERAFLKKLRYSALKLQLIILFCGAILGVSITFTSNIFYNFLLMPIVGIFSYYIFREKFYGGPVLIFILSIVSNMIYGIFKNKFGFPDFWDEFVSWIFFSVIYSFMVLMGWGIGWLLHYAFGKDKDFSDEKADRFRIKPIFIVCSIVILIMLIYMILKYYFAF